MINNRKRHRDGHGCGKCCKTLSTYATEYVERAKLSIPEKQELYISVVFECISIAVGLCATPFSV